MKPRLFASLAIGCLAATLCPLLNPRIGSEPVDFMWSLLAARDLVAGRDVYAAPSHFNMIPYPFPAVLIALPLAWLPLPLAASLFMGGSSALLAYGLLREGHWWRLLTFASAPYYLALQCVQWSPLMMAIMAYPALLPLVLAKPQYALPVGLTRLTRRRAVACAGFGLLSLAIDPTWPIRWLARIGPYGGFIPILVLPLLALAVRRWRDPRSQHFLLMACMPQHRFLYDCLLLWVLPRSLGEMLALTCASWVTCLLGFSLVGFLDHGAILTVVGIYLPALILVLREGGRRDDPHDEPGQGGMELEREQSNVGRCAGRAS